MYNVACIKWGTKFDADYVNKLYAGVKRHTTVPIKFFCFTENPVGLHPDIITHDFGYPNIEGWWQKLWLFSDDMDVNRSPQGRVLFIDLDTLITGNIDHYVTQDRGFVCLRDLWSGGINVGSAMMSFEMGKHTQIWNTFEKNPAAAIASLSPHGDQKWIQQHQPERIYWQDLYQNEILSFKSHCRNGLPKNARIVCYHGLPSIVESLTITTRVQGFVIPPTPWVADHWKVGE